MKNYIINESNCMNPRNDVSSQSQIRSDLEKVCQKLDTVIQLLKDLQVNLNINGDMCSVTVFDDGRVRMNRKI